MRKRHKKEKPEPEVPTSALSDIAFLLIIFFIVATTLAATTGIVADMPSGERSEDTQSADQTPIVNLADGSLRFNETPMDLPGLEKELLALRLDLKENSEKVVMFEVTGKAPYQQYFEILAAISNAGGVVALVTE